MKIAIDARFINPQNRGLSCYTKHLVHGLAKIDQKNEYYILLRDRDFSKLHFQNSNFHKVRAEAHWYGFKEQFIIPRILKKINPDITHFPHFNVPILWKGPFISTIHDLILFAFPTKKATTLSNFGYFFKEKGYHLSINHALKKSRAIISVSKSTAKDINKYFPEIPQEKVTTIYEGAGEANEKDIIYFQKFDQEKRRKWLNKHLSLPKEPYILYLGGAYPHKNLEKLALAVQNISPFLKEKINLVIAGGDDFFFQKLKDFVETKKIKNVFFPGFVKDKKTLNFLYFESLFCIFPSLYEGFGLPPLEALKRKKLVLCSRSTSFPEILKNKAIYFKGSSIKDIGDKILYVISNISSLEKNILSNSQDFLETFSWERMAEETLQLYQKINDQ